MTIGTQCSLAMRHIFGAQSPKFFTKATKETNTFETETETETKSEVTNEIDDVVKQQDVAWILLEVLLKIKKQEENTKR